MSTGDKLAQTGSGTCGLVFEEPTLFAQSVPGRRDFKPGGQDVPEIDLSRAYGELAREEPPPLPELAEADVVRHFTRLSLTNYSKDLGFYPLGSCTMKYNPKIANQAVGLEGFADTHPYQSTQDIQGNLEICWELERWLAEISGMSAVTLWPAAGSHGELVGMLMIRAYHANQGNPRKKVLIPDSAHGTNPASATISQYEIVTLKSGPEGILEPQTVEEAMDRDVAAIMLTNPNTLGIFEENFRTIADIVHAKGGLVYLDGANLNALMGYVKPGQIGADVMHFNLHKTFGTPHGGGGPGSGPVGVVEALKPFLPLPRIVKRGEIYELNYDRGQSIGQINSFFGNFGVLVRAYTYIRELGAEGLAEVTRMAVLNANYVRARLAPTYHLPYTRPVLHECVFSDRKQKELGVRTMDIAKRLMDYGLHAPTVYFPLIVPGAIMIEPTETESKDLIDSFCDSMIAIAKECEEDPETVKAAPHRTFRRRLDEVRAAKEPILKE